MSTCQTRAWTLSFLVCLLCYMNFLHHHQNRSIKNGRIPSIKNKHLSIHAVWSKFLSLNLDDTKRSCLDWGKRLEIICEIAQGILYFHQDSRLNVIHRDLKSSNVLLDTTLNPKISNFRIARIFEGDQIEAKTNCWNIVSLYISR